MNATETRINDATAIVQRHWSDAWRWRLVKESAARRGRYTKAKQYEADIAAAKEAAVQAIVNDLRAAGYTIEDN